jgi:WhiB family redox-sensing transcriptional regulator
MVPPTEGACVGQPTDWWFPVRRRGDEGASVADLRKISENAKRICRDCFNQKPCLEYSLHNEPLGIWGGLDEGERALLRRARKMYAIRAEKVYIPKLGTRSSNGPQSGVGFQSDTK